MHLFRLSYVNVVIILSLAVCLLFRTGALAEESSVAEGTVMDFEVIQENIEHVMSQQMPHKDKVCYDVVGCFDQKGLLAHIRLLPKPPAELATRFRLHSRSGSDLLDIYAAGGMTLSRAYRPGGPLKILAHGLGGSGNLTYLNQMKDAFLRMVAQYDIPFGPGDDKRLQKIEGCLKLFQCKRKIYAAITGDGDVTRSMESLEKSLREVMLGSYIEEDGNVVVVDWARGASLRDYAQACANAELVGREVAFLVSSLTHNGLVLPWNVHLIGFSLGAQLLGFAARRLARTYGLKAGRLTALDCAAPLFEFRGLHPRKQDVLYLDALHTSAGTNLLMGHVGLRRPFGHVDFYPNGGIQQKGCEGNGLACSHERAYLFFVESLSQWTRCRFKSIAWAEGCRFFSGKRCGRGPTMGLEFGRMGYFSPSTKARGVHYLETNPEPPFCKE